MLSLLGGFLLLRQEGLSLTNCQWHSSKYGTLEEGRFESPPFMQQRPHSRIESSQWQKDPCLQPLRRKPKYLSQRFSFPLGDPFTTGWGQIFAFGHASTHEWNFCSLVFQLKEEEMEQRREIKPGEKFWKCNLSKLCHAYHAGFYEKIVLHPTYYLGWMG